MNVLEEASVSGSRRIPQRRARISSPLSAANKLSEDQRYLRPELPVGAELRLNEVIVGAQRQIDGQLADPKHAPGAAADRYGPLGPKRLPVGRDDRRAGDIPAAT